MRRGISFLHIFSYAFFILFVTASCNSGTLDTVSSERGGGGEVLSQVTFTARGYTRTNLTDRDGRHFDTEAGTRGEGGVYVRSLYDSAEIECDFFVGSPDSYSPEMDNKYEVRDENGRALYEVVITNDANGYPGARCSRGNSCINCLVGKRDGGCSISCNGNVPSNYATDMTYFGIHYHGRGRLMIDYPVSPKIDIGEMGFGIRARVDDWEEFRLEDAYSDLQVCTDEDVLDGGDLFSELRTYFVTGDRMQIRGGDYFDTVDATYEKAFLIYPKEEWLGVAPVEHEEVDRYLCPVSLETVIPVQIRTMRDEAGKAVPGYTNNLSRGSVTLSIGICDDYANPSCSLDRDL